MAATLSPLKKCKCLYRVPLWTRKLCRIFFLIFFFPGETITNDPDDLESDLQSWACQQKLKTLTLPFLARPQLLYFAWITILLDLWSIDIPQIPTLHQLTVCLWHSILYLLLPSLRNFTKWSNKGQKSLPMFVFPNSTEMSYGSDLIVLKILWLCQKLV